MEFHISRKARDKYLFDESLFSSSGNIIFSNFHAVRTFTHAMNARRDLIHFPETAVKAGQINAMGLIDEILHHVVELYREEKHAHVVEDALCYLDEQLGRDAVDSVLQTFADEFPTVDAYRGKIDAGDFLTGETNGTAHREILLEELMMLWLANVNPAFSPYLELFDDTPLKKQTVYPNLINHLKQFFDTQPLFGPDNQNLLDLLRSPAVIQPYSLMDQLNYIREKWGLFLQKYLFQLLSGLDFIKEEQKMVFDGPGPTSVIHFDAAGREDEEAERFSPDRDWMPNLVLMAKCVYVWLDQLSKKYDRSITTLDQIPDEELDALARWGFTGLWLIGLWERSRASRTIKQMCGNPEALASAYSLIDYEIAQDLGGDEAFESLRQRAWNRGIRLAGDMVPNHMGIDSHMIMEHPDWFVQLHHSPYPVYSFNGENLSGNDEIGVFLEDHYYDRSDASVVFKWVNFSTGETRFIYHGNDGTSMPWNDTAQLNYLKPEVREALIQTILNVARKFPIIRFDAAMTITKRHFQRLWFPEPGTGGDIPTRADKGMTREEFNTHMPQEFWREVVDRIAQEAPDTLLLAEAFWLMEGFFVRTLGMHRVYNSAFMNMLKNEENEKFRYSIKNVLEFNPEILKRFVNFMNNPDEDTAIAQFGKGDKYIGVCLMLASLPGLPMFGHGQVEGFTEKYGMEYRKAYWDEQPDQELIERHHRFIFPIVRKRYLYADVTYFLFYDFFLHDGRVNENVFAYSNRSGNERSLVVYHNTFDSTRGWIKTSVAFLAQDKDSGERRLMQKNLGQGLFLRNDPRYFVIFRDHITGLEYIRSSREIHEKGLYAELGAYKYQVFLDFREIEDNDQLHYTNLMEFLGGRGVPSISEALHEFFLQPVHRCFEQLVNPEIFQRLLLARIEEPGEPLNESLLDEIEKKLTDFLTVIQQYAQGRGDTQQIAAALRKELTILLQLPHVEKVLEIKSPEILEFIREDLTVDQRKWYTLLGWLTVHRMGEVVTEDFCERSRSMVDEYIFGRIIAATFHKIGSSELDASRRVALIKILSSHQGWADIQDLDSRQAFSTMKNFLEDNEILGFLKVNRYQGTLWFNKECFEELVGFLYTVSMVIFLADKTYPEAQSEKRFQILDRITRQLLETAYRSEYNISDFMERLKV